MARIEEAATQREDRKEKSIVIDEGGSRGAIGQAGCDAATAHNDDRRLRSVVGQEQS